MKPKVERHEFEGLEDIVKGILERLEHIEDRIGKIEKNDYYLESSR